MPRIEQPQTVGDSNQVYVIESAQLRAEASNYPINVSPCARYGCIAKRQANLSNCCPRGQHSQCSQLLVSDPLWIIEDTHAQQNVDGAGIGRRANLGSSHV